MRPVSLSPGTYALKGVGESTDPLLSLGSRHLDLFRPLFPGRSVR